MTETRTDCGKELVTVDDQSQLLSLSVQKLKAPEKQGSPSRHQNKVPAEKEYSAEKNQTKWQKPLELVLLRSSTPGPEEALSVVRPANPFSPSFGISPPVLAGRRDVLNSFDRVFGSIRSPSYATLLWGPRGTGKTVLLNAVEDRAGAQGWMVVSSAAVSRHGLVDQIASKASDLLTALRDEQEPAPRRAVTGVTIMGTGIQTERLAVPGAAERSAPDLDTALAALGRSAR